MNKGVNKGGDNFINESVFGSFRRMCKKAGSLYELPDGKEEKNKSQLKVLLDGCPDVNNVVDAVEKAIASSKTAIA